MTFLTLGISRAIPIAFVDHTSDAKLLKGLSILLEYGRAEQDFFPMCKESPGEMQVEHTIN